MRENNDQQTSNNQGANKNKIEHFAITLPKGGGAIRGIEEKFQANAVTGTGSFSIPLPVTPGRSGFTPQLALSYDSGAGNSEFGLGWGIGLPCITRKTDKELPRYRDFEESDTFIISGAEDLVPVLEKVAGQWRRVVKTKREAKVGVEVLYTVYPYRPRIEGLFAKIEKWVRDGDQDTHWRATTKDNLTSIYGKSQSARIADPEDGRKIFKWLIEQSYDAKGNLIVYEYKNENRQRIPDEVQEQQRLRSNLAFTNQYLKRVKYSNYNGAPDRFHLQLVCDYGEHRQDTPTEDDKWAVRQDPFSWYKAGFEIRTYRLCRRFLMFHNFTESAADQWELVRATELIHEENPVLTYLTSVILKGYRKSGAGYETKALPPLEFNYTKAEITPRLERIDEESLRNLPVGLDSSSYQWLDLEGEGLPGLLTQQDEAILYKDNLGNGKFGPQRTVKAMPQPLSVEGPADHRSGQRRQ